VVHLSNSQFHNTIAGLGAESTQSEWSIEEMSNVLFEEAKDLYELCEKTLSDAIQSPDALEKGTRPEKRIFGAIITFALMVILIENCLKAYVLIVIELSVSGLPKTAS
jgi:hypothetical protein